MGTKWIAPAVVAAGLTLTACGGDDDHRTAAARTHGAAGVPVVCHGRAVGVISGYDAATDVGYLRAATGDDLSFHGSDVVGEVATGDQVMYRTVARRHGLSAASNVSRC